MLHRDVKARNVVRQKGGRDLFVLPVRDRREPAGGSRFPCADRTGRRRVEQNWKTPTQAGSDLVRVTGDDLLLSARFKVR
jgi:hypothetical protein